jgi:hypothetical protein
MLPLTGEGNIHLFIDFKIAVVSAKLSDQRRSISRAKFGRKYGIQYKYSFEN